MVRGDFRSVFPERISYHIYNFVADIKDRDPCAGFLKRFERSLTDSLYEPLRLFVLMRNRGLYERVIDELAVERNIFAVIMSFRIANNRQRLRSRLKY